MYVFAHYRCFFQGKVVPFRQKQEYMQKSIIGRKEEIALLEKYMTSNHSEFIAICGRRRVGKTFIITKNKW
jgi:hypothetical protein